MKKIFSLLTMALLPMLASAEIGTAQLKFSDITAQPGENVTLTIEMDNDCPIRGIGANLNLPDGVEAIKGFYNDDDERYYYVEPDPNRMGDTWTASFIESTYKFLFIENRSYYSAKKQPINPGTGPVCSIILKVDSSVEDGIWDVLKISKLIVRYF
ncbi:MAG: hypothetical protein IJV06_06105 [Bacteroidaceae bacterium]|nr:hypothetical protein [Bacteroidaceae bacterium]MBR1792026.1 hypothetical protein [Bacteroidales bacterium]